MSSELEQRSFGRTGEKVSVIGLSGAALYKHSFELGVATVKHALDLGVTYFDTSPAYGEHSPEGRWLAGGISQLIMGEGLDGTTRPHLPGQSHFTEQAPRAGSPRPIQRVCAWPLRLPVT